MCLGGAEGGTCKERSDGIASKQMRLVRASQIRHTALRTVKQKDLQSQVFLKLVPKAGLEPARCRHHRILSPARLPIPPLRHLVSMQMQNVTL